MCEKILFNNKTLVDNIKIYNKIKSSKERNNNLIINYIKETNEISIYCKLHNHLHKIKSNENYIYGCPYCKIFKQNYVIDSCIQNLKLLMNCEYDYEDDILKKYKKDLIKSLGLQILNEIIKEQKYKVIRGELF